MSPTPKKQPMVACPHCGAMNDPSRGSNRCFSCNLPLSQAITPFTFPATGQTVRTVEIDGEPWFVAADVTAVLGYSNGRMAVGSLPDRMKGSVTIPDGNPGNPNRTVLSEPGVYRLVMRSDLPTAEAFQDWLAEEVVPAIRRTGSYSVAPAPRLPDIGTPEGVLALARQFVETAEALVVADAKVKELEPKALAHDRYLTADKGDRLVREVAKLLGWKERDLRAFLLDEGLIFRKQATCGTYYYDAYARYADHFKPVEKVVEHTWGPCAHYTLYVRPSGVDLIQRRIERQRASIEQSIGGT
jgi:anti-repressor protein